MPCARYMEVVGSMAWTPLFAAEALALAALQLLVHERQHISRRDHDRRPDRGRALVPDVRRDVHRLLLPGRLDVLEGGEILDGLVIARPHPHDLAIGEPVAVALPHGDDLLRVGAAGA